jgi:dTDP-glucose 4,6-dehydratase
MRLLITGGAGFIGSHFIKYILKKHQNCQIINLDKLTYCGNLDNLREIEKDPRYRFIKGDICNSRIVNKILFKYKVDTIINFAAETHVARSYDKPQEFFKTNTLGTFTLLEAARHYNKIEKFIQISTDKVYGSLKEGVASEKYPLNPSSPYAASKAVADIIIQTYFYTYGLPCIIVRLCNIFGPNQYPEKVIPLFITNLLENRKISLHGDGLHVREWLYVADACEAIELILAKGKIGEIYNVGSGIRKTNLEIAYFILRELGKTEKYIEYIEDLPVNDKCNSLDWNKIRKELDWKPRYDFEESLKRTILWYKDNYKWWRK